MEKLMTDKELAQYFGIAMSTLYKWAADGKLPPHYVIAGKRRYSKQILQKFLEENEVKHNV